MFNEIKTMFKKIGIMSLLLLGTVFGLTDAHAQRDSVEIRQMLEERDSEIKELLGPKGTEYTQQQRDKLKDIINNVIDYSAMARYALQETYDTLSQEQRDEFVDLFSTIIRDQSLNKLDIYRAEVTYNRINVNGDSAFVNTTALLDRVRTPVYYDLYYKEEPGQWVVTDMTIDDVSTAESYRQQFQRIIRKKGYNSLLETLRKRAAR